MRRIFPGKSSTKDDRIHDLARVKQPVKKERSRSPAAAAAASASVAAALSSQEALRRSSISDRSKRTHWCPSCPSDETARCETPPSGDENVSFSRDGPCIELHSGNGVHEAVSHFRLGLPDECQDKQVLRPSINAATSSPEPVYEWTSGLQEALDQLVVESQRPTEAPSPAAASPLPDSLSSPSRLLNSSQSVEFDPPRVKLSRSLSRSSNDGASIMVNPRSQSFSEWSTRGAVVTTAASSDKRPLSARAVAEKLAKAIRGSSNKPKDATKRLLPPMPQTPPRSCESTGSHSAGKVGGAGSNGKQIIEGLQQSLSDMMHTLNTQNSRIQRLTGRNDELFKLYRGKERELSELQAKVKEDDTKRRARDEELKQVKDKLKYVQERLSAQGNAQAEVSRLRRLLESATDRVSELDLQVRERDQKLSSLSLELKQSFQELKRYRDEMPRVIRQRDGMRKEAEQLGHEALRMSAEAEMLKRRVHELEEEVMIRDGHLSILRNSLNNNDDC